MVISNDCQIWYWGHLTDYRLRAIENVFYAFFWMQDEAVCLSCLPNAVSCKCAGKNNMQQPWNLFYFTATQSS